jgi:hypothetical protein
MLMLIPRILGTTVISSAGIASLTVGVSEHGPGRVDVLFEGEDLHLNVERMLDDSFQNIVDIALDTFLTEFPEAKNNHFEIAALIEGETEDGNPVYIVIPFQSWDNLTGRVLWDAIDRSLNSSESFLTDFSVKFSFRWSNATIQGKGIQWRGDMNWFIQNKRGIIEISPDQDTVNQNNCFFQFLALGLSYFSSQNISHNGTLFPSRLAPFSSTLYSRMISSRNKYKLRSEYADLVKQALVPLPVDDMDHLFLCLHLVERKLGIHICLFSYQGKLIMEYPPTHRLPYLDIKPTLFGLLVTTKPGIFQHVHFLKQPTALIEKSESSRVCFKCFAFYQRSRTCTYEGCKKLDMTLPCPICHNCDGICATCKTKDCGAILPQQGQVFQPYLHVEKCPSCHRVYFSDMCKELHDEHCPKQFVKRCTFNCGRHSHRGLLCNETRCMLCSEKMFFSDRDTHECYLQRQVMKKPSTHYWSYDVETALDDQQNHQLYLIVAWSLYPKPYMSKLQAKYPYQIVDHDQERPFFIFWGLKNCLKFFDFVCDPLLKGSQFFAHNAGRYDSIFVENFLVQNKQLLCNKIERGLKILQMHFSQIDITFKDSIHFIPTSLRCMSSDFGIQETKKGFFPHKLLSVHSLKEWKKDDYWIPAPEPHHYSSDFSNTKSGKEELKELELFLSQQDYTSPWNVKDNAIAYCISDVKLLGETLLLFREQTLSLTSSIPRDASVKFSEFDVLQYVTLPSAVMKFYMSQLLPQHQIGIIDSFKTSLAKEEEEWLFWESIHTNVSITRVKKRDTISISGESSVAIYRYLNCYMHGCQYCYSHFGYNSRLRKSFKQCYEQMESDNEKLRQTSQGKLLKIIWECDWQDKRSEDDTKEWFKEQQDALYPLLPLDPRDAYKGGLTEVYKLYSGKSFQMVDFVSQYPTSLLGQSYDFITGEPIEWYMPIGQPIQLIDVPIQYPFDKLGVVKCRILPPADLYTPLLGYSSPSIVYPGTTETLYGLCKSCMDSRNWESCPHSFEERSFIGTWTCSEIKYALTLGYQVLTIFEVWEYQQKSNQLFRNFIVPFMIAKICCKRSGLVQDNQFTPQGEIIKNYVSDITGQVLTPEQFKDSPSERTIAKLIMNSFYGKWGQRSSFPETQAFEENDPKSLKKCKRLMTDPDVHVDFGHVIQLSEDRKIIYLEYTRKKVVLRGDKFKNDLIAAHVTAYGRIMLVRAMHYASQHFRFGANLLCYCDTDSIKYITPINQLFLTGFRVGDLELELKDGKRGVWMKRKSYAEETDQGKVILKQKGVALKLSHAQYFTYERLLKLIKNSYSLYQEWISEGQNRMDVLKRMRINKSQECPTISVPQTQFVTHRAASNPLIASKQTITRHKHTFGGIADAKRVPRFDQWNQDPEGILDTLPFGYTNPFFYS